ncbi:hypothetical protein T05_13336 [Trichinella murrelli]|uniref:Uncharacterized protein n=1 Tax=Trichinella murrelli TaxID=144512 RepID=A0A0V0SQI8_9BILA|nr:hypothetical protein T05_13336 [Trichinella murrelli]
MRLCSKSLINVWHRTLSDIFASLVASDELLLGVDVRLTAPARN